MSATEQQVRMAAQLYQARDAVRRLLGDKYAAKMAELGEALQRLADARGTTVLKEAIGASDGGTAARVPSPGCLTQADCPAVRRHHWPRH